MSFSRVSGDGAVACRDAAKGMRLRPHKRWDEQGVASTVGTIMALMVFLAFLSMFTSQYVPVLMEENEASHMSTAYGQFAAFKQAVDLQILAGTMQGTSTVQMFSPIKLGAEGIPMFAAPTSGTLGISRAGSFNNVSFSYNNTLSVVNYNMSRTGGTIKLYVPNRYFIPQTIAYEGDALILKQSDGEYMKATPQFSVTRAGSKYLISYVQVDMRGDDSNFIGFGTRGIKTSLRSVSSTTFTNLTGQASPSNPAPHPFIYINYTTWYEKAWNASFNQTLWRSGMAWGPDMTNPGTGYTIYSTKLSDTDPIEDFYMVTVCIRPELVERLTLTLANIEVSTSELGAA